MGAWISSRKTSQRLQNRYRSVFDRSRGTFISQERTNRERPIPDLPDFQCFRRPILGKKNPLYPLILGHSSDFLWNFRYLCVVAPTPLNQISLYRDVIKKWAMVAGLDVDVVTNHAMRATAATNALSNKADIAEVQKWLGHSNVSTTKLYDRRDSKPEDSPTFRVNY